MFIIFFILYFIRLYNSHYKFLCGKVIILDFLDERIIWQVFKI